MSQCLIQDLAIILLPQRLRFRLTCVLVEDALVHTVVGGGVGDETDFGAPPFWMVCTRISRFVTNFSHTFWIGCSMS